MNQIKEFRGYTIENIYTKFLKDHGVKRFKELTREQFNEYQKIYYQLNKHTNTQNRVDQICEICNDRVKNMWNHHKSTKHKRLVEVIEKYSKSNLKTISEN